jgi:hypothetical protein
MPALAEFVEQCLASHNGPNWVAIENARRDKYNLEQEALGSSTRVRDLEPRGGGAVWDFADLFRTMGHNWNAFASVYKASEALTGVDAETIRRNVFEVARLRNESSHDEADRTGPFTEEKTDRFFELIFRVLRGADTPKTRNALRAILDLAANVPSDDKFHIEWKFCLKSLSLGPLEFLPVYIKDNILTIADPLGHRPLDTSSRNFLRKATPDILSAPHGWFECELGPAGGKTKFSFQLMTRALLAQQKVFYCAVESHAANSLREIVWPLADDSTDKLLILDNAHLLEDRDVVKLIDSIPRFTRAVALSRSGKLIRLRPRRCTKITLGPTDLRSFLLQYRGQIDKSLLNELVANDPSLMSDWEAANALLDRFPTDDTELREIFGHISEFLKRSTLSQLERDRLEGSDLLIRIAAFQFLDIGRMSLNELRCGVEEFNGLVKAGWIQNNGSHFMHPNKAERILRALDHLGEANRGATIGRIIAETFANSSSPVDWQTDRVAQVRRHVRYGELRDAQDLLQHLYKTLVARGSEHRIPLDEIYVDLGSEHRRRGSLGEAQQTLESVSLTSRGLRWRYERAYVHFLCGTAVDLGDAIRILEIDMADEITEANFMNRGQYAIVLARQGLLMDAYERLDDLYKLGNGWRSEDARRWVVNIAAHRHELGAALMAHGLLLAGEAQTLFEDFVREIGKPVGLLLGFNEALHCAVNNDAAPTRKKAYGCLHLMKQRASDNFEQEATYLALAGAASEVLGDVADAKKAYQKIARLRADLDNRRGMTWANDRLARLGDEMPDALLLDVVRCLYPIT